MDRSVLVSILVSALLLALAPSSAQASYELADEWDIPASPGGSIATDTEDHLYLTFYDPSDGTSRIIKFDSDGGTLAEWRGPESPYEAPTGLATDTDDHVYLARSSFYFDPYDGFVVKFDPTLSSPGPFGYSAGDVGGLGSLAVDSNDNLYMSVLDECIVGRYGCGIYATSVHKFDAQGNFVTKLADGTGGGELRALATDPADRLYVVSGSGDGVPGSRIDKYTAAGNLIGGWNSSDDGGEIATDSQGRVFLASPSNRILVYDSPGTPLGQFGSKGTGPGQFDGPAGIATDSEDNLYVVDRGNNRIQRFTEALPKTTITSGPTGPTNERKPSFEFSSSHPSSFECSHDDGPFVPCRSPVEYPRLADGPHSFRVRATDKTGSVEETPARSDFTVDTVLKGSADARAIQTKRGNKVRVKVKLIGKEKLNSRAKGKIVVRGSASAADATPSRRKRTYRLGPKTKSLREGQAKTLFLKPKKPKHAGKIANALKRGLVVRAKPRVKLIDQAGNTESEKLKVELRRPR